MTFNVKNFLIMLGVAVLSVGLVVGSALLINPQIEEKENKETLVIVKKVSPDATKINKLSSDSIDGVDISLRTEVYNKEVLIGHAYKASATNGYGSIELLIYIENESIKNLLVSNIEQTLNVDKTVANVAKYIGSFEHDVDAVAGATISSNTVKQIVDAVIMSHKAVTKDKPIVPPVETHPYKKWFGEDYQVTDTNPTIDSDVVSKIETIESKGFVYTASKKGIGSSYSGEKEIEIQLILDSEGKILGYIFTKYEHSTGNYQALVQTYLDTNIVGLNVNELVDESAGSTSDNDKAGNSIRLISSILNEIKKVYGNE